MNPDQSFDLIVQNFVASFNQMCRLTNRAYLLRAQNTKGETGQKPKNYPVEYKLRCVTSGWEIYAEWRKWYFFYKEFPFVTIYKLADGSGYRMTGLFTESMHVLKPNAVEFQQGLHDFLVHCRDLPEYSFVNV